MTKFRIRYKYGAGPNGLESEIAQDTKEIEAAAFITQGDFIDFYSDSEQAYSSNLEVARGKVVFRVAQDVVADIERIDE